MHRLSWVDLSLVAIYLAGITLFGLQFRSKDRSLKSYFLADRKIPWWAIALSIVAAETSTLTIISVPGLAYTGDWGFLQIVLGYLLGRIVVCILFLPRYFRGELLTAYEVIGERFGPGCISSQPFFSSFCGRLPRVSACSPFPSSSGSRSGRAMFFPSPSSPVDVDLHPRRRNGRRHLDRRGADGALCCRHNGQRFCARTSSAGRLAGNPYRRLIGRQAHHLSLCLQPEPNLYLLGRGCRRLFPDHGQSWYRSTDGPAPARSKKSARIAHSPARQRRRYPGSVRAFSCYRDGTLLFLR